MAPQSTFGPLPCTVLDPACGAHSFTRGHLLALYQCLDFYHTYGPLIWTARHASRHLQGHFCMMVASPVAVNPVHLGSWFTGLWVATPVQYVLRTTTISSLITLALDQLAIGFIFVLWGCLSYGHLGAYVGNRALQNQAQVAVCFADIPQGTSIRYVGRGCSARGIESRSYARLVGQFTAVLGQLCRKWHIFCARCRSFVKILDLHRPRRLSILQNTKDHS